LGGRYLYSAKHILSNQLALVVTVTTLSERIPLDQIALRVCLLVVSLIVVGLAGASRAQAYGLEYFCPASSTGDVIIDGNGSCWGKVYSAMSQVKAVTTNGDGVDHCAVGKQNSDGSGSDVIPAQCGTAQVQLTPCVIAVTGVPKIANHSASAHHFWGEVSWASYPYLSYCF
jgi:hypothetical protein